MEKVAEVGVCGSRSYNGKVFNRGYQSISTSIKGSILGFAIATIQKEGAGPIRRSSVSEFSTGTDSMCSIMGNEFSRPTHERL